MYASFFVHPCSMQVRNLLKNTLAVVNIDRSILLCRLKPLIPFAFYGSSLINIFSKTAVQVKGKRYSSSERDRQTDKQTETETDSNGLEKGGNYF